ncbi:MAG: hypothetical protein KF773_40025 [Deltaproteobacteria bacterium]|nr:hypothetical protein [Deltaproteobacteria bacterium]MCW5807991.1 hypothetical protein [Deltaproteobacteria bacterium]
MRNPAQKIRALLLMLAMVLGASAGTALADARSDARDHYMAGVKFYNASDFRSAIREFSAAHQLAPADLNNYNLALCYDKLGEAEPAMQYYRAFLGAQPATDKKAEIEASIQRLDAAVKSASAKKAEELRKADELRRAEEARAAEEARKADEARRVAAAEEARRKAEEDARKAAAAGPSVGPSGPSAVGPAGPVGGGSTGTVSGGTVVSTGDRQLDRASAIDINSIRDQRVGGGASGMPDTRGGPSAARGGAQPGDLGAANGNGQLSNGQPATAEDPSRPNTAGVQPTQNPAGSDTPKKVEPVYKKWWFWAVVAVSAYVVYSIATENSSDVRPGVRGRELPPLPMGGNLAQPGGMTLLRF